MEKPEQTRWDHFALGNDTVYHVPSSVDSLLSEWARRLIGPVACIAFRTVSDIMT